jgi:putative nucleotidyltransferase with HDIG domain
MQKTKKQFSIPEEVRGVSLVLSRAGFENFLVGGCVRDTLLGKKPKDWDITTNATPEQVIELFPKTFYENEFGTVGVVNEGAEDESLRTVEVTPYRLESGYSDFRRPDKVEWGKNIEDDLARRDFTINALAYDVERGELLDVYGGEEDIEKKVIRTVGEPEKRFGEDALRMLRAVRLSAELGFAIEQETLEAVENNSDLLEHISKERIRDEFVKIVMSDSPAVALELLYRLNLLEYIAPELLKGIGVEQGRAHAYNVWEHLLRSLEHAAKREFPLYVRLAALFHDVAKPHTREWKAAGEGGKGQWTFYGHEVVGARIARTTLNELRFPKDIVDKVVKLVRWHMFFSDTEEISLSAVRRMVRNVSPELIWDLMDVRAADRIGTGRPKENPYRLRKYRAMIEEVLRQPISVKQLAVGGEAIMKLLGKGPGPYIGFILEILLSEVLDNPELNTKEYLEKRVYELYALPEGELEKLGKEARAKNAGEEEKEVEKIKGKYSVK